ncbi:uncharacterized protein LOC131256304 [Magnolia sinica]|uniref:uncharacterized protein LOC131256304 n=1 Tax=Magnolia sinica TaxID=86752 RepID=UPI002657C250|nr:uncharacterized protein LOC131256304 [Magnolia sinica]
MAMSDELENSGKLVVRPEQHGLMEDSRGARVDSNKLDEAASKKSDVQEEEVTTGGFRESNGDRESMRAPDTTESGTARGENADPFESIEAHDHHQFEEKEFKAKITCGNRLIGYRKYKVLSFDMNSIKRNEVTSGGTECVGLDWLDGLDGAPNGYFPQNGNSSQLNKTRPLKPNRCFQPKGLELYHAIMGAL